VWLAEQINPGTPVYNIFSALRLRGRLDVAALRGAVSTIYGRHTPLRTSYRLERKDVVQRVGPPRTVPMPLTDLAGLPGPERQQGAERAMRAARDMPLDLSNGDVFRVSLLRLAEDEHIFLMTVHHIAFDAWSWGIFRQELQDCYSALVNGVLPALPPLPLQYDDFAVRQRGEMSGARLARQLEYWRDQLRDLPATEVAGSKMRPADPHWGGSRVEMAVPVDLARRLEERSRANRVTLFMTYLSAFQVLLCRYTGARELAVASPVAGRTSADVEKLIGLFINTLILRADLSDNPRFLELLARTRDSALDAFSNQEISFDHVVDEVSPPRTLANPFTQVLFGVQNAPGAPLELAGLHAEPVSLDTTATKMDLRLSVGTGEGAAWLAWGYRTELFARHDIEGIGRHYLSILEALAADPTLRVLEVPLLGRTDRDEILAMGRGRPVISEPVETLHDRFRWQALETPDAPAVSAADGCLSYQDLDRAAGALAVRLQRAGAGRGELVAIAIDRSAAMAVAVLAVLRVGGAYVPVDPTLPANHAAALLTNAASRIMLVDTRAQVGPGSATTVLRVDVAELLGGHDPEVALVPVTAADLAYVLYTSGSTGRPKGVAVTHGNVLSYLASIDRVAGLAPGRYAMVQPLAVDSSVTMLYGAWFRGGTLYAVPRELGLDAAAFVRFLRSERIDYLKIAPSHLEALQQAAGEAANLMPARWLMIGGEASPYAWARELAALRPGCAVYNHYGPTEATVGVLVHLVQPVGSGASTTPLGRPLAGTNVYVLDAAGHMAPPLVAGELCIGGAQVARGYLGLPARTAAQFVADPFSKLPGARMYRTGDRVRLLPDGTIEFLGREDEQVKIRGNRVELSEIAAVLRTHPGVREAVVRAPEMGGRRALVGYVTPRPVGGSGGRPDQESLRAFLAQRLPDYMIPSTVQVLNSLPLTRHGKLDIGSLPAPAPTPTFPTDAAQEPRSAVERRIAEIWGRILGLEMLSRHGNFFQLGGHSLLATRAAGEVTGALGIEVPVARLFSHPTPASLAAYLAQASTAAAPSASPFLVWFTGSPGLPTLVCVHPISGSVGCYAALAGHLSAYSVVGVESEALRTGAAPLDSVPGLAEHYLAAVRAACGGNGPYLLAGWSMGGLVAYEMALRMAAAGGRVDRVILIDTVVPREHHRPPSDAELTMLLVRDMASTLGIDAGPPVMDGLATLNHDARLARVRQWLSGSRTAPEPISAEDLERRYTAFCANHRAQSSYRPPASAVPVTLIRPKVYSRRSERWGDVVADHLLTVHELDGDHYSLLREPTVTRIAGWLRQHLAAAAGSHPGVTGGA
jgi:amino acid adenylation domain-containing protein